VAAAQASGAADARCSGRHNRAAPARGVCARRSSGRDTRRRTLPTQRSACAFARGAAIGARITVIPSERKTSSKPAVNLQSRSRIRKRGRCSCSARVMIRLRAAGRPRRLLAPELPPAQALSPGWRLDLVAAEHVPDAARRQGHAESDELAVDALVAPARVLGRQAQDELPRLSRERRPAGTPMGIAPAAPNELAMSAKKRRRLDEERLPARSRQRLAERRQQSTIGRPQALPRDLTPQHLQLMPKNEDLHLFRPLAATAQDQQLEQAAKCPVDEGQDRDKQTPSTHPPTLRTRTRLQPPAHPLTSGGSRSPAGARIFGTQTFRGAAWPCSCLVDTA
jgi:hypothetical protein